MKRRHANARWLLGLALIVALGALVLAGCGGGSSSSSSSSGSTTAASSSESNGSESSGAEGKEGGPGGFEVSDEQRACLKEKGVELPEFKGGEGAPPEGGEPPARGERPEGGEGGPPSPGFGGKGSEEMTKAFEECGVEAPEFKGGPGGKPGTDSAAFKKRVKEYVACVRENGYEIAEPNFSGEGPIFEKSESESSAFKKASAKCESLLGGPGPAAGSEGGGEA